MPLHCELCYPGLRYGGCRRISRDCSLDADYAQSPVPGAGTNTSNQFTVNHTYHRDPSRLPHLKGPLAYRLRRLYISSSVVRIHSVSYAKYLGRDPMISSLWLTCLNKGVPDKQHAHLAFTCHSSGFGGSQQNRIYPI